MVVSAILLVVCLAGIAGTAIHRKKSEKKGLHTAAIVLLSAGAAACVIYLVCAGLLPDKLQEQPAAGKFATAGDLNGITTLHLISVEKEKKSYYINAKTEDGGKQLSLLLSDDVVAYFQRPDWVGAWSPEQYLSAKALYKGFQDGAVAEDARFTFELTDGKLSRISEVNYYEGNSVTGSTGEEEE